MDRQIDRQQITNSSVCKSDKIQSAEKRTGASKVRVDEKVGQQNG